jgi:hypothetical protein
VKRPETRSKRSPPELHRGPWQRIPRVEGGGPPRGLHLVVFALAVLGAGLWTAFFAWSRVESLFDLLGAIGVIGRGFAVVVGGLGVVLAIAYYYTAGVDWPRETAGRILVIGAAIGALFVAAILWLALLEGRLSEFWPSPGKQRWFSPSSVSLESSCSDRIHEPSSWGSLFQCRIEHGFVHLGGAVLEIPESDPAANRPGTVYTARAGGLRRRKRAPSSGQSGSAVRAEHQVEGTQLAAAGARSSGAFHVGRWLVAATRAVIRLVGRLLDAVDVHVVAADGAGGVGAHVGSAVDAIGQWRSCHRRHRFVSPGVGRCRTPAAALRFPVVGAAFEFLPPPLELFGELLGLILEVEEPEAAQPRVLGHDLPIILVLDLDAAT